MSDDESGTVGPSPAKSIVSVASTVRKSKESAIQAKVAAMLRQDLEEGMIKLVSKLQAKEKLIKELTPAATAPFAPIKADNEKLQRDLKQMEETINVLKDQLKQQQIALDNEKMIASKPPPPLTPLPPLLGSLESWRERAMEAESKLATSEDQVMTLIQASKDGAIAHGEQLDEMITELRQARLALEESQKVTQEMREKELMYQQQLGSLKVALRDMGAEREAAFISLSEGKEQAMDQASDLNQQLDGLKADLESKEKEVASLSHSLETSEKMMKKLKADVTKKESSPHSSTQRPHTPSSQPQANAPSVALLLDLMSSIEQGHNQEDLTDAMFAMTNDLLASVTEIKRLKSLLEESNAAKEEVLASRSDADEHSSLMAAKEKEIKSLMSELAEAKKKLMAAAKKGIEEAKKRDHEAIEMQAKLSDISSKHQMLSAEVDRLRPDSQELITLKTERVNLVSTAAAKQKELDQAQSLMQEYKLLASQKDSGANQALAKAEAEVKRVQVEMERALSKVESRLHEKEIDCEGLVQQLSRAEKEASDLRRALEGNSSGAVAELRATKAEAEASRVELLALKKEIESERQRAARALDEAKKRLNKAQKLQHAAELEVAESRGKAVAEREGGKLEAALANQALETCRRDLERLDVEMRDYKSRAQALLKQKDSEIREARESLALTMVPIGKCVDLEAKLLVAEKALGDAITSQAELEESHLRDIERERSTHSSIVEKLEGRVKYFETLCTDAHKELSEWRNKAQALEARLFHHRSVDQDAGIAAVKEAEEARGALSAACSELDSLREELMSCRMTSEAMMEAKDSELLLLVRRHTLLHEELTAAREQLAAASLATSHTNSYPKASSPIAAKDTQDDLIPITSLHKTKGHPGQLETEGEGTRPEEGWENAEGWGGVGGAGGGGSHLACHGSLVDPPASLSVRASSSAGTGILETLVTNPGLNAPVDESAELEESREVISSSDFFGGADGGSGRVSAMERTVISDAGMALHLIKLVKDLFDEGSRVGTITTSQARASSSSVKDSSFTGGPPVAASLSLQAYSLPSFSATESKGSEYESASRLANDLLSIVRRNREIESELVEMGKELSLREEMEAALKESLRETERASVRHSRSTIDVEYLKNTVLKMYRTGDAEQLLPVFAMILAFGPDELKSCQAGLEALRLGAVPLPAAAAAVDATLMGASNMLSFLWGGPSSTSSPPT